VNLQKVILDADIAGLYEVPTSALTQAVRRNLVRFPSDFMFQLTPDEVEFLRSQSVISKPEGRGGRRYLPYAFTGQGVAMLSTVLRSRRAILVNIEIMRAFVRLRRVLSTHRELAEKLAVLERRYDGQLKAVFEAIRRLMEPERRPRMRIGFRQR
jgi:hypothetical protein